VASDYSTALDWIRKAAEQGFAPAQSNMGVSYYHGRGVSQDYAQAALWFRKAAEQGDALAQAFLGGLYLQGQGVPQDDEQAYFWLAVSGYVEDDELKTTLKLQVAESHLTPTRLAQEKERVRKWLGEHPQHPQ
jgi:uncharacterized protein